MKDNETFIIVILVITFGSCIYGMSESKDKSISTFRSFYNCVLNSVVDDGDTREEAEKLCGEIYYSQEEPPDYSQY